jgi:hypothetical protein
MQPYPHLAPHMMMPQGAQGAADVGIFGKLPCPHCGMPTRSSAGGSGTAARMAGGLVGWLIVSAFMTKYYCMHHGEIPPQHFPPAHQSAISTRKLLKIGGGVALFMFVIVLMALSSLLG